MSPFHSACPRALLFCLAVLVAPGASALEACIGSTAELQTAVNSAALTGSTLDLKLRTGAFQLDSTLLTGAAAVALGNVTLDGGYNADCSVQTLNPTLSKLTNFNNVNPAVFKLKGSLQAHNLELQGPITFRAQSAGSHSIGLERVRVRESAIAEMLLIDAANAQAGLNVLIRNSVFHRFNPDQGVAHGLRVHALDANSALTISNSTFAPFATSGLRMRNLKLARFYNNIFWQSPTDILEAADATLFSDVTLFNNTLGSFMLLKAPITNSGTLTTNPLFVSPNDLHLQNGSPAINTGTFFVVGGLSQIDFDGGVRVQGSAPDRGAHESIFSDLGAITVTNTNDAGAGSLRQAIINSKTQNIPITINFNIPGGCPQLIELVTPLESVGKPQQTIIDGYTQPGASRSTTQVGFNGTPCVFVSGKVNNVTYAMNNNNSGNQFKVSGLAFGGFTDTAIKITGTGAINIEGNAFGLGLANQPAGWMANKTNIRLEGGASNKTIGGPNPGQRNLLNSATSYSVIISSGTNNQVVNNYIGLDDDGMTARGNQSGLRLDSSGNLVQGNYFAGNTGNGIVLIGGANNNVIKDNSIGRKHMLCLINCNYALGNAQFGISIGNGASGNLIESNLIAHNGEDGIRIAPTPLDGSGSQRNRFLGNRIYSNGGMGIELQGMALAGGAPGPNGFLGPNPINTDPLELANETNAGQNAPTITSIVEGIGEATLTGNLQSRNGSFLIEAFASDSCDSNGHGEGQNPVGNVSGVTIGDATASSNGSVTFEIELDSEPIADHQKLTLIATDALGNSSEFSACVPFRDALFAAGFE